MHAKYQLHESFKAPWHKFSFDRFLFERLPALLGERLPLAGYQVLEDGDSLVRLRVTLAAPEAQAPADGPVTLEYGPLPRCDEEGLFYIAERPYVVVPIASQEELDQASIECAGEQLARVIQARLAQLPDGLTWDAPAARAFLPLDGWINDFLAAKAQLLDTANWHSRHTHLCRILIPRRSKVIAAGQMGRVDPFEVPEGSNIGKVFTVASGAAIDAESGRLVIRRSGPTAALGPNALMIPFLEHDDANRLLMGDNMMRQAVVPEQPEPALVQTGFEPAGAGADFWCGANLLTAFIAGGEASMEDGLILSESAARRLRYPYPAEPGDKLSNRHGTKGVVSQVLPDAEMPHLPDGTPVEILFSFSGLAMRMNFGQVREALMGWIARVEGKPAVAPPFQAPTEAELRARLAACGLPENGMQALRWGRDGAPLPLLSTAGWVYWYRLVHLARAKLLVAGADPADLSAAGQEFGERELDLLRAAGAQHLALELLHGNQPAAPGAPTPFLHGLGERLAAAGISVSVEEGRFSARFSAPAEEALELARPLPHPWLREQRIGRVGKPPQDAGEAAQAAFEALARANDRLARWTAATPAAPEGEAQAEARQSAYLKTLIEQVENRLAAYLDSLLPAAGLEVGHRLAYSGRAVIAPALGLRLDQVGLPEPFIQKWFAPLAQAQGRPLADVLAESWVVIERQPAVSPTALMAFHPAPASGSAIRLHPQVTRLLDADFDGDQLAVILPRSPEAQREAAERLSVAAHLRRDPALAGGLLYGHEIVWGLAWLSLDAQEAAITARMLGVEPADLPVPLTQEALFAAAARLAERDVEAALPVLEGLAQRGYAASRNSGASLSPFVASALPDLPPPPEGEAVPAWQAYLEAISEQILALKDYSNPVLGPQLLSAAVRPRSRRALPLLLGPRLVETIAEQPAVIRHGNAHGFLPDELFTMVAGARRGLAQLAAQVEQILQKQPAAAFPSVLTGATGLDAAPLNLLARARRARNPGIIFARAAASGETDPLRDPPSRLLAGLL